MSTAEQAVQITLTLPKDIYERVAQVAGSQPQQIEQALSALIAEGLDARATVRELLEHVSSQYRERLAREGRIDQSSDEVLQELRDLREQIARELYP